MAGINRKQEWYLAIALIYSYFYYLLPGVEILPTFGMTLVKIIVNSTGCPCRMFFYLFYLKFIVHDS